jgi:peptidoglycan/LPS O-acetylase OafA/YrhL
MQSRPSTSTGTAKAASRERLYYVDWLRVLSILLVFLIHCSKIFDYHTQVVANTVRSPVLSAFRDAVLIWVMPLFFVLSGGAIFLSRGPDRIGKFVKSRFVRLVVPLISVGTFIINAVYVYIERLSSGKAASGFFQWYPRYFDGFNGFGGNFAPLGHGTHLWYLEFLFIYSLILLPLFVRSKKRGTSLLSRLSVRFEKPWALLLLFLPVAVIGALVEMVGMGGVRGMGGWDPISYLFFLGYGYLVFSNARIGETIKKAYPIFLTVAIVLTALFLDTHFGFVLKIPGILRHDVRNNGALLPIFPFLWVAVQALRGLMAWCWIIGLLGLGRRFLNLNSKFLAYANEAGLPFYILHHAVIYVVGYYITQWNSGAGTKFILIAIVSFAIVMAIYEALIRRFNWVRFALGMRRI